MKVFYDNAIFDLQKFGGISKYHAELIKHFLNDKEVEIDIGVIASGNVELNQICGLDFKKPFYKGPFKHPLFEKLQKIQNKLFPNLSSVGRNWKFSNTIRKKGDYDIFHPTYYYKGVQDHKGKLVITIHDMIFELFPQFYCQVHLFLHP